MALQQELGLRRSFRVLEHEAVLNIYYTGACIKKKADDVFRTLGLTDVQFSVMMLLHYQSGGEDGLSQSQLSDMMLVNRANITTLVDRMEKADIVVRTASPEDRRRNIVKLTKRGKRLFAKAEPLYSKLVRKVMSPASSAQQRNIITILGKIRSRLL
jgi:DNA-binding MarR family transcriptional regulator